MAYFLDMLYRSQFRVAEQWREAWSQGAALQGAALAALAGARDPWEVRARWFSELGRLSEDYMRSPVFLRASRDVLDAMITSARLFGEYSRPVRALARPR